MNKSVVVFEKEKKNTASRLIANGIVIRDNIAQVTPLYAPSSKIIISNVICCLSCSIAIGPLLFNLRKTLCGFPIPNVIQNVNVSITAYADDVTVLVSGGQDVNAV